MDTRTEALIESLAEFLYGQSRANGAHPPFEEARGSVQAACRKQATVVLSMIGGLVEHGGFRLVPVELTPAQLTEVQIACPITLPGEPEPAVLSPEVLGKVWAACLKQVRPAAEKPEPRRQTVLS